MRKLIAAIACRNEGSRLFGKPLQNLSIDDKITVLDSCIQNLEALAQIDEVVLGISEGSQNVVYGEIARNKGIGHIFGDERDVVSRLIACAEFAGGTDVFRVTSECPFIFAHPVAQAWNDHVDFGHDATFMDDVIDGCGWEIISLEALKESHRSGEDRHRSELCTLYIRENKNLFSVNKLPAPDALNRKDLRLTVDNPEDLIVCRSVFRELGGMSPLIPIHRIVQHLDEHPELKELLGPFTEKGYESMYL